MIVVSVRQFICEGKTCFHTFAPRTGGWNILTLNVDSYLCWSPKRNNFPKCNQVLYVITFGPKCNKVLNVISLQCNRLTPSVHCCYGGHPHWDVSNSRCTKKPLTSIHVTLRARWYQSASFYLLDIMVHKAVYWSSWRKSFPAQSGLVLGWKLNRMESIGR